MKKSSIIFKVFACIAFIAIAFMGFRGLDQTVEPDKAEITGSSQDPWPQLLLRNDALSQAIEWEATVKAVNAISSELIENPEDAAAMVRLAKIYTNEARVTGEHGYYYPAILALIDRALEIDNIRDEQRFEALGLRANTLMSQHRFADALVAAQHAQTMSPNSPSVYAALVDANVELGNYGEAVRFAQKLVDMRPDLVSYSRTSYLRELHGDVDGAIEAMNMAVTAGYPGRENTEWARITLAELYQNYGKTEEAMATYAEALNMRDDYPFALAGMAGIKRQAGEYHEAERLIRQALNIIPEFSFQEELLLIMKETNRPEEAKAAYHELLAMLEDDMAHGHTMNMEYAEVLFRHGGQTEKALDYLQREYRVRPNHIGLNTLMAEMHLALDEKNKAAKHLEKATITGSLDPSIVILTRAIASR